MKSILELKGDFGELSKRIAFALIQENFILHCLNLKSWCALTAKQYFTNIVCTNYNLANTDKTIIEYCHNTGLFTCWLYCTIIRKKYLDISLPVYYISNNNTSLEVFFLNAILVEFGYKYNVINNVCYWDTYSNFLFCCANKAHTLLYTFVCKN